MTGNEKEHIREFLELLDRDIEENPSRLKPITREWVERMDELTEGVEIGDLTKSLDSEDEVDESENDQKRT